MKSTLPFWIAAGGLCLIGCLSCGTDSDTNPSRPAGRTPSVQNRPAPPGGPTPPAPPVQPAATLEELFAAVERDPGDPDAHHELALALHRAGRREESIGHFEVVTQLTNDTRHLVELGAAYTSVSRFDEAQATLERALEADPGQPAILQHMGNLYQRRGDTQRAIEMYHQALEADPNYLIAQFHLAQSYLLANKHREAYRAFERVLQLEPRDPMQLYAFDESLFQLGYLDLQMGATERAVQFFELLIEKVPDHPKAHGALADALAKLGRHEAAAAQREAQRRLTNAAQP